MKTIIHSTYSVVFLKALAHFSLYICLCILYFSVCISVFLPLPFLCSLACHAVTTTTHQQQRCSFSSLTPCSATPPLCAVCLLLQCCFTHSVGVARVRQPRPGTRWFHDSGAPCLANLPAAGVWGPAWLIIPLSLSLSPPLALWLHLGLGCSQASIGWPDPHQGVCTDIYLDGGRSSARLRRKGKCRAGK